MIDRERCDHDLPPDHIPVEATKLRVLRATASFCLAGAAVLAALWGLGACQMPTARAATISPVNTTADNLIAGDGYCTLREAVMNANADSDTTSGDCPAGAGADTIVLPAGFYTLTIVGGGDDANSTGDLDATGALTISGAGAASTRINANGIDRVFDIPYNEGISARIVISGIYLTNGVATSSDGGGIRNSWGADLTILNSDVYSNRVTGVGMGGGVFQNGGALTSIWSYVNNNASASGSGGGAYVYNAQALLSGGNVSINAAGGATDPHGGGGLYLRSSQVILENLIINSNESTNHGGGLYVRDAVVTQTGSLEVRHNDAGDTGGGFYVSGTGSRLVLGTAVISNNTADDGGGVAVNSGKVQLSGTVVARNRVDHSGGGVRVSFGVVELTGASVIDNQTADGNGAGICIYSAGSVSLSRSYVVGNSSDGDGAGIFNQGLLTVTNSTLSGNETLVAGRDGGALTNDGGTASITFTTIVSNTAHRCAGGICMYGEGTVRIQNTLLAHNRVGTTIVNCSESPSPKTEGHNLEDVDTCGLSATGDIKNIDPKLGPLSEISGTLVYPLQSGSPAIDAGICVTGLSTDQRGVARPQGLKCDIGAYEAPPSRESEHLYLPCTLKTGSGGE